MAERVVGRGPGVGHLMAQIAACHRGVGLARAPKLRLLEVRGSRRDLDDIAQQAMGCSPALGQCTRLAGGWWVRRNAQRALVLADGPPGAGVERLVGPAISVRPDVAVEDLSEAYAALVLAGPLAQALTTSPATRLAGPVLVAEDGDDRRVLVLSAGRVDDAWQVLLDAGRRLGAVAVDVRATDLHRASRRRPSPRPIAVAARLLPTDPLTTGVPLS